MKKTTEQKTENKKAENKKPLNWIDDMFAVSGVRNYNDNVCFFNLYVKSAVGNVAIYGCKVFTTKDGKDFISMPSSPYRMEDGVTMYHDHASIIFDTGVQTKIIKTVESMIE